MGRTRRPSGESLRDYCARAVSAGAFAATGAGALSSAAGGRAAAIRWKLARFWLPPAWPLFGQAAARRHSVRASVAASHRGHVLPDPVVRLAIGIERRSAV
jgi:hypothetical protein